LLLKQEKQNHGFPAGRKIAALWPKAGRVTMMKTDEERRVNMPVLGLPALISIAAIGLFLAACQEEPQEKEAKTPAPKSRSVLGYSEEAVDPAAPRMLDPTKPDGSGVSKK
jgi:hypothetical protein